MTPARSIVASWASPLMRVWMRTLSTAGVNGSTCSIVTALDAAAAHASQASRNAGAPIIPLIRRIRPIFTSPHLFRRELQGFVHSGGRLHEAPRTDACKQHARPLAAAKDRANEQDGQRVRLAARAADRPLSAHDGLRV